MNKLKDLQLLFRKLTGVFIILALLGLFLSFYFLKYVPDKRNDFHRSAFQELSQIEGALQERNDAFRKAIQSILEQHAPIETSPLIKFFQFRNFSQPKKTPDILEVRETQFEIDSMTGVWQISYLLYSKNHEGPSAILSKNLDTLMTQLVGTYKDIFDGYLLIKDKGTWKEKGGASGGPDAGQHARIIFNSSNLSVDYQINTDSLLKKPDGFSFQDVHNVVIEGNSYKLFLYPLELGKERIILAGLISLKEYSAAYNKIPFNFISFTAVLILLLLIHLPILKIYLLGAYERIRDLDIRLIIGTYFIAAFVGFFLFSKIFLDQTAVTENKKILGDLSDKIQRSLMDEIDSACSQLAQFDASFKNQIVPNAGFWKLVHDARDSGASYQRESAELDSLLKPGSYPYLDNVFWIDSSGKWVARWAFKKIYANAPLINVADRKYFKDFNLLQYLTLPHGLNKYQFTIQPTLSRLDGEYSITVAIAADSGTSTVFKRYGKKESPPKLVGLGAPMHFVCHSILPPGYNFSIINDKGDVLYDSKPGRALLSSIVEEMDDPSEILQSARYHTERFFDLIMFRGRQMSLLATPVSQFPYTLLVYYRYPETDGFEEHLIGLSAFLTGCILILLICISLINEWVRKKPRLLQIPVLHFEWIYPADRKINYYRHLTRWMLGLLGVYLLTWMIAELLFKESEFTLFFITLSFPFYIALHYYVLRENYYFKQQFEQPAIKALRFPSPALLTLLGSIILVILCIALSENLSPGKGWLVLLSQAAFLGLTLLSIYRFVYKEEYPKEDGTALDSSGVDDHVMRDKKLVKSYITAILTGVFMISIIPASGIFWLIFRQETSLELNSDRLYITRIVNLRRAEVNERLINYKAFDSMAVYKLKFQYGIYPAGKDSIVTDPPFTGEPFYSISPEYTGLHRRFFPRDSIMLAWTDPPGQALDGSWYFFNNKGSGGGDAQIVYTNHIDHRNEEILRMKADPIDGLNAAALMLDKICSLGIGFNLLYFGSLLLAILLAYRLTASIVRRIFLLDLFESENCRTEKDSNPDEYLKLYASREDLYALTKKEIPFCMSGINEYEKKLPPKCLDENILAIGKLMIVTYSKIWEDLSAREKFILYDFALDGFANYKTGIFLHCLLKKNILHFEDHNLSMMTLSFREFVLENKADSGVSTFMQKAVKEDPWKNFKMPLMLILAAIGLFVFITQDAAYQKITGLLTSISSLLPFLSNLFGKGADGPKSENPGD
jgi:hypothetical protein